MATGRTVLDRLVVIMESVTVDTVYDSARAFRHDDLAYAAEDDRDHSSPTRLFVVVPTGQREAVGAHGASGSPLHVDQVFEIAIVYRQTVTAAELFRVVVEDVDRIGFEMLRPAQWDQANSGISRIRAGSYSLELDEGGAGGSAVLTIPLGVHYRPSHTG